MQSSLSVLSRIVFYGFAGFVVLLAACRRESPPDVPRPETVAKASTAPVDKAPPLPPSFAEALAGFNRGAALLEQYRYTEAAKAFEAVLALAPDWQAARFNLGLAYLNIEGQDRKTDRFDGACQAFDTILKLNPQQLHARFCRGLCYQHIGDNAKALECFEAVYQHDKADPCVAYKCAESLLALGRNEEAIKMLEKSLQLDPGFVSAAYRLALQHQRAEQTEKADALFQRFRELSAIELTGGSVSVQKVYGMSGKYYFALGADSLPLPSAETGPIARVLFAPEIKRLASPASTWTWSGGAVGLPGIAVGDLNGDGHLDLVLSGIGGDGSTSVWINDGSGRFSAGRPFATHGTSPCLGDVDNAGRLDLWLGTATGSMLFQNDGKGNFGQRAAHGLPQSAAFTAQARLRDIDSDGDLDLLAFRLQKGSIPSAGNAVSAKSSVYRNNRDGSFTDVAAELGLELADTPVAAVVSEDFDNDGDMDIVIFPANGKKPIAWVNDRAGKYHLLDAAATGLDVQDVISATSGDPNKDGKCDLLVFAKNGVHLYINRGGFRFEEDQDFWNHFGTLGGTGGQFADMKNDGNLDIVIPDAHRKDGSRGPVLLMNDWPRNRFVDAAELDPGILLSAIQTKGDASCVVADFSGKGRCDILLAPAGD
ncbi:MAG: FG-GAP-like repeat-containing protein, partial [Thermoguttaceae bacterium]